MTVIFAKNYIMIQRIQSIYLLLASIALFLTVAFGFSIYSWAENEVVFSLFGLSKNPLEIYTWFPYNIVVAIFFS